MALTQLTKVDGGGISTTSDYRVGIITAIKFVGPFDGTGGNFTGVVTASSANFSGDVSIGGTLTYEDVTNIDSVGIITAKKDIHVGAGVSAVGVGTFGSLDISGDVDVDGHTNLDNVSIAGIVTASGDIFLPDNQKLKFGNTAASPYTEIVFSPSDGYTDIVAIGGTIRFAAEHLSLTRKTAAGTQQFIFCDGDNGGAGVGNVNLYQNGDRKFRTIANGAQVESATGDTYLNVKAEEDSATADAIFLSRVTNSGASSYLMFGDADDSDVGRIRYNHSNDSMNFRTNGVDGRLIIDSSGNLSVNYDLDVDGHTNLDNVSIAGVTTFSNHAYFSNNVRGIFGAGSRLQIVSNGTNSYFDYAGSLNVRGSSGSAAALSFLSNSNVLVSNNLEISKDLDVDGHTNLDNVSIAGVTTITGSGTALQVGGGTNPHSTKPTVNISPSSGDAMLTLRGESPTLYFDKTGSGHGKILTDAVNLSIYNGAIDNQGTEVVRIAGNGNVSVYKDLDVDGHTNLDNVSIAGVTTFSEDTKFIGALSGRDLQWDKSDNSLEFLDMTTARFGTDNNLTIYHNSSNNNSYISENGVGSLLIQASDLYLTNTANEYYVICATDGRVQLNFNNNEKLRTTNTGIDVTGEVAATQDYPNQRPALDFNFAQEKVLDPRLMFARDGEGSYYDEFGLVRLAGRNEPRFDHDPVTRESKGLLMEETRTNHFPYGTTPGDLWSSAKSGTFEEYTTETTAPDGTFTATKWTFTNNDPYLYHTHTLAANYSYTVSMWVKAGTNMAGDYLQIRIGGAPYSPNGDDITIPADGTWKRISYTKAIGSSNETNVNVGFEPQVNPSGNPASGDVIYIWGAQLEVGHFMTSFIPTNGASRTRNQDTMIMTGDDVSNIYNNTEGTMFYEASVTDITNDNQPIVAFRDQSNASGNEIAMGYRIGGGSSGNIRTWMRSYVTGSQVNSFLSNHGPTGLVGGKPYKHIFGFKKDDAADSYNTGVNSSQATDSNGNLPVADSIDELRFGAYYSSITTYALESGHIKRFSYWPVRLTNAQLNTYIA